MYLLHMPSSRYRFPSRPFFPSVFSFRAVLTSVPTFNTAAPLEATSSFLLLPLFFTPLHTQWIPSRRVNSYEEMRQAQKDWAETARDTWTHWESSQGDQKSAGRAWKTLSLREKEALTPEATPAKGKERSLWKAQPQKPALAFPGLYLFLGGVVPSLPLKKVKESPNAQAGDTVGVEGLWGWEAPGGSRPSSALSCSRTKDAAQKAPSGTAVTGTPMQTTGDADAGDDLCHLHSLGLTPGSLSPVSSPFPSPPEGQWLPQWQWQWEESGSSWGPLLTRSMALTGVPAHLQRAGRARPDAPRSRPFLPKPLPAYTPKSGFPHLLALFAFSQRENIYYCHEVINDYGNAAVIMWMSFNQRKIHAPVLFLMSFNVQAFCWLLSLSNVPIDVFSLQEHHVLSLCYI